MLKQVTGREQIFISLLRELTDAEKIVRITPTPTEKLTITPIKSTISKKNYMPTQKITPTLQQNKPITAPPTVSYDVNGFPENAKQVTVSEIVKTPSVYADGVTNVTFTCRILSFARNDQGDAVAVNCVDPTDMTSILQVDIGNFDIKQININDTIRIFGFVTGVGQGKNGFGADITEALVSGMYINDLTSGYDNAK